MKRSSSKDVVVHREQGTFDQAAYAAILAISPVANTRKAYSNDFSHWMHFCRERGIGHLNPRELDVTAWIESMRKDAFAPKTRARRHASLCTIYRRLKKRGAVESNPFSLEDGPEREKANAIEPTPSAEPEVAKKLLETCDDTPIGKRDRAIIRFLWATGARRASLVDMTFERFRRNSQIIGTAYHPGKPVSYELVLIAKGGKELQVLVRGQAAIALGAWLGVLREGKFSSGPIWRSRRGPLTARGIGHMLQRRAKKAGIVGGISPHMFRVAFLTYNPAGLEAKQAAAGHADPATTRLYDRASWRGREAFEAMPEIEDVK